MAEFMGLQKFYQAVNLPVEPAQEAAQFNIFRVEHLLLPGNKPVSYTRRNFYKASLVTGESNIHYAGRTVHVPGSVLVFTNPAIPFFWERVAEKHSGFVCIFTEAFFNRIADIKGFSVLQSAEAGVILLDDKQLQHMQQLFERMQSELYSSYAFKYDLCRALLLEVVHTAQKMKPEPGTPITRGTASERIARLFAELLERQFPVELANQVIRLKTPDDFARALNVHVNHLNKALKQTTGQTTSQLINGRIAEEAKLLLTSTHWAVNEIAWSLGFKEPNHFSAFFKTLTGITPKQFRQAAD